MKENSAKSIAVGIAVKIVLLAVLVLVLIFTGRQAYTFGYQIFAQEAMSEAPGKKVAVTITKDMSFGEIAKLLEEKKLIKYKNVFRIQYMLSEYKGEIEPGSYVLNTSQTAEEMLRVLSRADEKETETE